MPGGGGVPGRHFQELRKKGAFSALHRRLLAKSLFANQGNLFIHHSHLFICSILPYLAALSGYRVWNRASSASGSSLHRRGLHVSPWPIRLSIAPPGGCIVA